MPKFIRIYFLWSIFKVFFNQLNKLGMKTSKRQKPSKSQSKSKQKYQSGSKKSKKNQITQDHINKKTEKKQSLQAECFICASLYNLNRKLPIIACPNNHTFCLNCITMSIKASKPNCPLCRTEMQPIHLNQKIYQQVLGAYKQKNKHIETGLIEKTLKKIGIKNFSKKHSSLEDMELFPRKGKLIKRKNDGENSLLVLEPELKEKLINSFRFTYYPCSNIEVSFGVCIYDKFLMKIVENCGFDTKIVEFFMKKKENNMKVDLKKGLEILVNVDLQKFEIHWFSGNKDQTGSDQIYLISSDAIQVGNQMGELGYYPYCVLYNVGDSIELNK